MRSLAATFLVTAAVLFLVNVLLLTAILVEPSWLRLSRIDTSLSKLVLGGGLGFMAGLLVAIASLLPAGTLRVAYNEEQIAGHLLLGASGLSVGAISCIVWSIAEYQEWAAFTPLFSSKGWQVLLVLGSSAPFGAWLAKREMETSRVAALRIFKVREQQGSIVGFVYSWFGVAFVGGLLTVTVVLMATRTVLLAVRGAS